MLRIVRLSGACMALLAAAALALRASAPAASASTSFQVIHRFHGGRDGARPAAGLTAVDKAGDLFGTTEGESGGAGKKCSKGCGNTYSVEGGNEQTFFSFNGKNGEQPLAPLLPYKRKLYGTTTLGGKENAGVVFSLTLNEREKVLHSFCTKPITTNHSACADGAYPAGRLIVDSAGNLYGTTGGGGSDNCPYNNGCGTVFRISTADGSFAVIYSFCQQTDCADGEIPSGGLVADAAGNLYGAADVIFRMKPDGSGETVLYRFCSKPRCVDGFDPTGDLVFDRNGNLYSTTFFGGYRGANCTSGNLDGCGVVFKLKAPDYSREIVLWKFRGGKDGIAPNGGLVRDKTTGDLYGTTFAGGGSGRCDFIGFATGCGTVFQVTASGSETVLYHFHGLRDGALPAASLLLQDGYLFGTASLGGDLSCGGEFGCGTVFNLQIQ